MALTLGGCSDGPDGDASRPSSGLMTIEEVDPTETPDPTPPPPSTSLPAVAPIDLPPLDLDVVAAGDEIVGPETGAWADLVPGGFHPCQDTTGPETAAEVAVWTIVRRGEPIGYLVGPATGGTPFHLAQRAYAACGGGTDDIGGAPQVRSWWTGCEAGARVVGRWREALAPDEDVFVASIRTGC